MKVQLLLRLFIQANSESEALAVARDLTQGLEQCSPIETWSIEPYWKIGT